MQVKQVSLTNFRNYPDVRVEFGRGRTILIGENAQGKSNFLEAIEFAGIGKSERASHDADLIRWGAERFLIEVAFDGFGAEQTIALSFSRAKGGRNGARTVDRQLKINGVSQGSIKALLGHLVTVSFKSQDLSLLRGGPSDRRDWIDGVILRLRPAFHDVLSKYQKVVAQRNRLLKMLFDKGRLTVSDQDQLLSWDKQLASFGVQIIKQRLKLLSELLPLAQQHQSYLSGRKEALTADYLFKAAERKDEGDAADEVGPGDGNGGKAAPVFSLEHINQAEEAEVEQVLLRLLKERRGEEIARRQSILGPHRDDIVLRLNDASAVDFASQGQQRSLVLSLKLAELERLSESLQETPVLLLDDVLAELDAGRQGLLMSAVSAATQTIITTTHLAGFEPAWLEDATIYSVQSGRVSAVAG